VWVLLWRFGELLIVSTVSSPFEADQAMRKKALSPIALKILGASSQSTKKAQSNKSFFLYSVPKLCQALFKKRCCIFRTGFHLWLFSFEQKNVSLCTTSENLCQYSKYLPPHN